MLLGAAVVLVVVAAILFTLFVRKQDLPQPEPVSPTQHLEERKAAIYENLRDLQFEYRVGKLSDADYQQTKIGLQKELAGVIAQIEQTGSAQPPPSPAPPPAPLRLKCPSCGTIFAKPMKYCGECGKAMA